MPAISTSSLTRKKPVTFRMRKKGSMQSVVQATTNLAQQERKRATHKPAGMRCKSSSRARRAYEGARQVLTQPLTYPSATACG